MILELYINGKKADVPDNFSVCFTYKETEVTKPTAIKNSFSKSVVLDGTPSNNKIFSSIYRLDKLQNEGDFNPNKRTDFKLMRNGDIVESGYIQLDNVSKTSGNVKYYCTLYGGLGSFFYNLQTNEDGTEKNLADLYYGFANNSDVVLTKEQENSNILFQWNSNFIKTSWSALSRINDGTINTPNNLMRPVFNITAAPTYSGYYGEDFDSQHVLVNLYNMPSSVKSMFPTTYTEDNVTYKPYLDDNSGYTLVECPRELSEFEVRDLRSMYQRRAIRNKLIIDAICNPENNGGYNVVIDPEILNSRYYKNTYLLLDKFDTSKIINSTMNYLPVSWSGAMIRENDTNTDIGKVSGSPKYTFDFSGYSNPVLEFTFGLTISSSHNVDKLYSVFNCNYGYYRKDTNYSGFLMRVDCYKTGSPNVRYASTKDFIYTTGGFDVNDVYFQAGLDKYVTYLNSTFTGETYTYSKDKFVFKTMEIVKDEDEDYGSNFAYKVLSPFKFQLTGIPNNVENVKLIIRIKRFNIKKVYQMKGSYSNWETIVAAMGDTYLKFSDKTSGDYNSGWTEQLYFKSYGDQKSYVHDAKTNPSLSYLDITKRDIFADTPSPYQYLVDFTKLFNAKYEIDNYTNTVYIKLLSSFYTDETVNIEQRIDRSKDIKILPTISKTKWISYKLDTPETYASYLYSLKNKIGYGELMVNTTYDFNSDTKNLFEDSKLQNIIPFRLSSNYFNLCKANTTVIPSCVQSPTYDVTLFNVTLNDIKQLKKTQNLSSSYIYSFGKPEYDFSYKLCCFDRDNNSVSDLKNSLVFFSGWDMMPFEMVMSDNHEYMDTLNGKPCYLCTYSEKDCTNNNIAKMLESIPRFSKYFDVDESASYTIANIHHTDVIQSSLDFTIPTQTFIQDPSSYDEGSTIYYNYWRNYISDLYDVNNKQVTCYVYLKDKPSDALKKFYFFDNSIWILNEITNYDINNNSKPTKCTFIKVKDKNNYLSR